MVGGEYLRCGWAPRETTESLGFQWVRVRLCPFPTFVLSHLFPLSRFDVGTDSLTDAVRLSLEVLNTQQRLRLR